MLWLGWQRKKVRDAGARFRAEHSAFLTWALGKRARMPRIPAKRTDRGGYSGLMKLETGEKRAALWWGLALSKMDHRRDEMGDRDGCSD